MTIWIMYAPNNFRFKWNHKLEDHIQVPIRIHFAFSIFLLFEEAWNTILHASVSKHHEIRCLQGQEVAESHAAPSSHWKQELNDIMLPIDIPLYVKPAAGCFQKSSSVLIVSEVLLEFVLEE